MTQRVSVGPRGRQANGASYSPSISATGRYIAFESGASNLVTGDTNRHADVFVRDRLKGTTQQISLGARGVQGNGDSMAPSISADGRYVSFQSTASNLVTGDSNRRQDVFVRDRLRGRTERVSLDSHGRQLGRVTGDAEISADGRHVAFVLTISQQELTEILVRDRTRGRTEVVSVTRQDKPAGSYSNSPRISGEGRYVAFQSWADDLVPGDTNRQADIFVRDRVKHATVRVSVLGHGRQANDWSIQPSISANGRYVAFTSYMHAGKERLFSPNAYLWDRRSGSTQLVARELDPDDRLAISPDGRHVAFEALFPYSAVDNNETSDIYAWDAFGDR